ncbi:hypothetical protein Cme02nite_12840 [Catellatospora methionotrophica]|uniref:Uncharacterized protein n=1 Tax=Catellatospora methionotrophica TaxID=121620 RepID=A0A8J3L6B1_9ACTN|nr:hypothetical protein Cme02nite_12840 [Catellatospora methionotrophica]
MRLSQLTPAASARSRFGPVRDTLLGNTRGEALTNRPYRYRGGRVPHRRTRGAAPFHGSEAPRLVFYLRANGSVRGVRLPR